MPTSAERRHLAVIPARGGSKRLPRKNVIDFFGRPILAFTIEAAKKAGLFSRVLVSTEDEEIARIARHFRADVDRRPPELGTDGSTVVDVCVELLERLATSGNRYDTLTVLYATAPLRTALDIRQTHALLEPSRCDFSLAASEFLQPVHQALHLRADGRAEPVFSELFEKRASDVGRYAAGNGSTYCADVSAFLRTRSFSGGPLRAHLMPVDRSVDIDTADDLELARFYGKPLYGRGAKKPARRKTTPAGKRKSRRK